MTGELPLLLQVAVILIAVSNTWAVVKRHRRLAQAEHRLILARVRSYCLVTDAPSRV